MNYFQIRNVIFRRKKQKIYQCQVKNFQNFFDLFNAWTYDYGRKTQDDYDDDYGLAVMEVVEILHLVEDPLKNILINIICFHSLTILFLISILLMFSFD